MIRRHLYGTDRRAGAVGNCEQTGKACYAASRGIPDAAADENSSPACAPEEAGRRSVQRESQRYGCFDDSLWKRLFTGASVKSVDFERR